MEENTNQLKSIWGPWWEPLRKWFYPAWLLYELTVRFYTYALEVYTYFINPTSIVSSLIGAIGTQTIAILSGVITFVACTAFLTLSACFTLYTFFTTFNLTNSRFEANIKKYF